MIPSPTESFWSYVDKSSGCWLWTRAIDQDGYGAWRGQRAHRVALASVEQPKHRGWFALHRCDVRACVNPDHLYWGGAYDNARDRHTRSPRCEAMNTYIGGRCGRVGGWVVNDGLFCGTHRFQAELNYVKRAERKKASDQ